MRKNGGAEGNLEDRIQALDDVAAVRGANYFIRTLRHDTLVPPDLRDAPIAELEAETSTSLAEAFPEISELLSNAKVASDAARRGALARAFLLSFASEIRGRPPYETKLADALDVAELDEPQPAELMSVLVGVGIVMLLQLKFDVSYEQEDGKRKLRIAVAKKPTAEKLIAKIFAWVP